MNLPPSSGASAAPVSPFPLSAEQRAAVERSGQEVCVVAGPGSGKTRVLIERFAWLIEQRAVDPTRILAITFTEKAAIEIKSRLVARFAADRERRQAIERAPVSTIDGFCTRVLRENAIAAGLSPDFSVLDQPQADALAREAAEAALDQLFNEQPAEMRRLLEALDLATQDDGPQQDLAQALLDVYGAMRVAGVDTIPEPSKGSGEFAAAEVRRLLNEILRDPHPGNTDNQREAIPQVRQAASTVRELLDQPLDTGHFAALARLAGFKKTSFARSAASYPAFTALKDEAAKRLEQAWIAESFGDLHDLLRTAIVRLHLTFQASKRAQATLDFGDLEEQTVRLLETNEEVRKRIQGQIDQVLMDELQDTNRLQWRLLELVCGERGDAELGRLFAVGDINQSIYGFRHAEPAVFAEYRQRLESVGARIDELRENYRSREAILSAVTATLDGQPGIEPRHLEARREFAPSSGPPVELVIATDDAETGAPAHEIEARYLAARIQNLIAVEGYRYKDCAILVRTLAAADPIIAELDRAGIPALVSGGRGFLETRECRDLLLLLAALVNPLDEVALYGVLRGPLFEIPDRELLAMGASGWRRLWEREFGETRRLAGLIAPDRLLARIIDQTHFLTTTGKAANVSRARANVDKFLGWLRREHEHRPRPLAEILEDLEAMRQAQNVAEAPPPDAGDVVNVMTIHASKGLEYPVVFVSALQKRARFDRSAILFGPDANQPGAYRLGVRWRHPVTAKGAPDATHAALEQAEKLRDEQETDRLLYVAMTRAEDRLILTYADSGRRSGWVKLVNEAGLPTETLSQLAPLTSPKAEPAGADIENAPLPLPLLTAQFDSATTVTAIADFAGCPRRYYLGRYLGLNRAAPAPEETTGPYENKIIEPARNTAGLELGSAVHRVLAGEILEDTCSEEIAQEARELAARFTEGELGRKAASAQKIEREFPVLFAVADPQAPDRDLEILLRGQIDLWFTADHQITLVDYKTDRTEAGADSYALQLRLYALALERYLGRLPDRAVLYYLRSNRAKQVPLDAEQLSAARALVARFMAAQESLDFPLRTGDQCRRCAFYQNACPAGNQNVSEHTDPVSSELMGSGEETAEEGLGGGESVMPDLFWPPSFSQGPPKDGS